jgi:hypothetical protein
MDLFEVAGQEFYFDLDAISDFVRIDEEKPKSVDDLLGKNIEDDEEPTNVELQGPLIDMTKWDLVKGLIESLLTENSIVDEAMGIQKLESQLSIGFRISFNTLIKHKLIKQNKK